VELINKAIASGATKYKACAKLNISQRTYHRWKDPSTPLEDQRPKAIRPEPLKAFISTCILSSTYIVER
jgi:hypothetical protein